MGAMGAMDIYESSHNYVLSSFNDNGISGINPYYDLFMKIHNTIFTAFSDIGTIPVAGYGTIIPHRSYWGVL